MINPDDLILEPTFYMDDTRRSAHVDCPKCGGKNTVIALETGKRLVFHFGCRSCRYRWNK